MKNINPSIMGNSMNNAKSNSNQNPAFQWLWGFIKPHQKNVFSLLLLSLVASALVLTQPFLTKQVIDVGLLGKDFDALLFYALLLLGLGIFSTLLSGKIGRAHV